MACIYGDIANITTKGASRETARSDNLTVDGVTASERMAATDLRLMDEHKQKILDVAREKKMDPAVIAAIISRETRANPDHLSRNGYNSSGIAFGLMQVAKINNPVGAIDSKQHFSQATQILIDFINAMKRKFPSWTQDQCLKGGIAAYNAGPKKIDSYQKVDEKTEGGDYSNDVVARARWFRGHGYKFSSWWSWW